MRDETDVDDGSGVERAPDILWRLARDRVLIHRVDTPPQAAAYDLIGAVALVWLALDEPATLPQLATRLAESDIVIDDLAAEVDLLLGMGLIVQHRRAGSAAPLSGPDAEREREVGLLGIFESTVLVSAAGPLADELRHGLANLFVPAGRPTDPLAATHYLDVELLAGTWTVHWDGTVRYRGPLADMALYDALNCLNNYASRRATELGWTVLHGGAVVIDGHVIAVVGHSGAGKSTLTTALTLRNHPYVADEVVAVRDDFTVEPFHRPVGLRRGGADRIGVQIPDGPYEQIMPYCVVGALGGRESLRLIAILRRTVEPTAPRIEDLTNASALFALANQTLGATDFERDVFRRLETLVRSVRIVELHYHDVSDAMDLLEDVAVDSAISGISLSGLSRVEPDR